MPFQTAVLPLQVDVRAPDGSDVRLLLRGDGGSMAHFELGAGETSMAVVHRTVEELWYFVSGRGEMWRRHRDEETIVEVAAGICVAIPPGVQFQFRAFAGEPLAAVAITMPPWPGDDEARRVAGRWQSSLGNDGDADG